MMLLNILAYPMMNLVLPALPVCAMVGIHNGSLGPNIPCGLIATVSSSSQLAASTI